MLSWVKGISHSDVEEFSKYRVLQLLGICIRKGQGANQARVSVLKLTEKEKACAG